MKTLIPVSIRYLKDHSLDSFKPFISKHKCPDKPGKRFQAANLGHCQVKQELTSGSTCSDLHQPVSLPYGCDSGPQAQQYVSGLSFLSYTSITSFSLYSSLVNI